MPTKYFTLKADVVLEPGQTVGFLSGKGYFAKGTPTKPKAPAKPVAAKPKPLPGGAPTATAKPPKPKPAAETPKQAFLRWLKWGPAHQADIHYAEARPMPIHLAPGTLPLTTDCSGWVTVCAKWAGLPDPNGLGYNGEGYTGTLLNHCEHIVSSQAGPGDLIVYGPGNGHHVVAIIKPVDGGDFQVCSHGGEGGPLLELHSAEERYQPAGVTFLRIP